MGSVTVSLVLVLDRSRCRQVRSFLLAIENNGLCLRVTSIDGIGTVASHSGSVGLSDRDFRQRDGRGCGGSSGVYMLQYWIMRSSICRLAIAVMEIGVGDRVMVHYDLGE